MTDSINNTSKKEKEKLKKQFYKDYEANGQSFTFDMVNAFNNNHILTIPFEQCKACETNSPAIDHECLICGQETKVK